MNCKIYNDINELNENFFTEDTHVEICSLCNNIIYKNGTITCKYIEEMVGGKYEDN